jgi:DNA polymerase III subunit beta
MKLTCNCTVLANAFQTVSGVVPSRTPKEILKNVKLEVSENTLALIATDSEVGIRYVIPEVDVSTPGEVLLPTARLIAILRELREESVTLESVDNTIHIKSGHSEFVLPMEDPEEFPSIAEFNAESYLVVEASTIREMIRRTIFATDAESTRYALGGIQLGVDGDELRLVATDSRRLALTVAKCSQQGDSATPSTLPVIPAKAMSMIERSLSDDDKEIHIAAGDNDILIKSGSSTIYSRLVEGRFPNYATVIPEESTSSLQLQVDSFYSAVRQAQIVTDQESRGVNFHFAPGTLSLDSRAADIGQSRIELPISYDGPEISITFDPRFVGEFLRVFEPEKQITLELTDSESAAAFKTDDGYTYVIMPLSRDR